MTGVWTSPAPSVPSSFRPAGELAERFLDYHLVRGASIERTVPTYRGEGRTFG